MAMLNHQMVILGGMGWIWMNIPWGELFIIPLPPCSNVFSGHHGVFFREPIPQPGTKVKKRWRGYSCDESNPWIPGNQRPSTATMVPSRDGSVNGEIRPKKSWCTTVPIRCRRCPAIRRFLCFGWRKLTPNKIYGTSGTRPVWKKKTSHELGLYWFLMNQIFAENHNHRFSIVFSYMKYMAHMVVFRPTVQPDDGPKRVSLQ